MSGPIAKPRVTMVHCKPCANPYDADDMPRHLPAGLTQYVLHSFATKSPPYHVTTDDVATPPILLDVAKITENQCVRGRGGDIAVLYETHWDGLLRPTWERELYLQAFRYRILTYWAAGPAQLQPHTRQHQQLRINAAARDIVRTKGERHLPGSYRLVSDDVCRARFMSDPLHVGASIWYYSFDGSWWLGKVGQPLNDRGRYVIRFLDNPGPALITLPGSAYNTALHTPCGSWCLQTHGALTRYRVYDMANLLDGHMPALRNIMSTLTPMSTSRLHISKPRTAISTPRSPSIPLPQGPRSSVHHSSGFLPIPELQVAL